ncbi:unnamed protein product [Sphagnum balticum]
MDSMNRKMRAAICEWQVHVEGAIRRPKQLHRALSSSAAGRHQRNSLKCVSLGIVTTFLICMLIFLGCDEFVCTSFQALQSTKIVSRRPAGSSVVKEEAAAAVPLGPNAIQEQSCTGRYIYIYDLPPDFNQLLVENCGNVPAWGDMCENLSNHGLGAQIELPENDSLAEILLPKDAWFHTDQFNLEVMFHERLKRYPCLTVDPKKAAMFYIPFYPALDLTRNLLSPSMNLRDRLSERLVGWLQGNRNWRRLRGQKHFLIFGRIVWDFVRREDSVNTWGNVLLSLPELKNVTKLLIERGHTHIDETGEADSKMIAIPYPTSFHPSTDLEIQNWQNTVRHSKRDLLVSFAGSSRNKNMSGEVRGVLLDACETSEQCTLIRCTHQTCVRTPQTITELSLRSVFCLQPSGDSPTRKGIFDCMLAGCIPVFFDPLTAYEQYEWHLPADGNTYSVYIDGDDVIQKRVDVMQHLALQFSAEKIESLRETIITQILPGLVYRKPAATTAAAAEAASSSSSSSSSQPDAFDIIIQKLLVRFRPESL